MRTQKTKKFYLSSDDKVFKELFLDEKNKDILLSIINTCLDENIEDFKYMNQELITGNVLSKTMITDIVLCTDKYIINIECNSNDSEITRDKNFSYACNLYAHQSKLIYDDCLINNKNVEKRKIIQINLTFNMSKKINNGRYKMRRKLGRVFSDKLIIDEYNMDKIHELWYSKDKKEYEKLKYLVMLTLKEEEIKNMSEKERKDKIMEDYARRLMELNEETGFLSFLGDQQTHDAITRMIAYDEGEEKGIKKIIKKMNKTMSIEEISKVLSIPKSKIKEILNN